jgi:hypothetical protein
MTHRPIQQIAIHGHEPGGTRRVYPILMTWDRSSSLIDEAIQHEQMSDWQGQALHAQGGTTKSEARSGAGK